MDDPRRVETVKRLLRDVQTRALVAKEAGPPCTACAHFSDLKCRHMVYSKNEFDPVTGTFDGASNQLASDARLDDGLCGPEALLFEAPSKLKRRVLDVIVFGGTAVVMGRLALSFFFY